MSIRSSKVRWEGFLERTQVKRLAASANKLNVSVAHLVRDAIDRAYPPKVARRPKLAAAVEQRLQK